MSLRSLSDSHVLSRIRELVRQERDTTLLVLEHLNEIERRRLHLKRGFQSLYDYCTSGLGYSSSAAHRRIQTARCVARFPAVSDLLQKNEVNLSTITQVYRNLTEDNHGELLSRIRGRSQREVEAILAEYQPGALPRDRVRTVVVRVPSPAAAPVIPVSSESAPPRDADACEKSVYCRNGSDSSLRCSLSIGCAGATAAVTGLC